VSRVGRVSRIERVSRVRRVSTFCFPSAPQISLVSKFSKRDRECFLKTPEEDTKQQTDKFVSENPKKGHKPTN
jgi:hypothetical protein